MCMTTKEMNETLEAIKSLKMLKQETEDNIKALEMEVIEYLSENEKDCRATNSKGKETLQFIGNMCKATLSVQERESVDKAEVKKLLNAEDYKKVSKISTYPVLRIS